ncbi:MAG: hypothetical protein JWQ27_727 [Ferruginibacter sp.]|nr:hypothetical protein [Ferruginibacter sp.]
MKKLFFACLLLSTGSLVAQVRMPAPSPTQTIKQDFALGTIELTYSRPIAKGRKIIGDLVPFNKVWRTGANAATIIKFTDVVEIGGKRIDTGRYSLYTVPNADTWEIILNKNTGNWGSNGYSETDDVVRVKVPVMKNKNYVESFTMQFDAVKPESCELNLVWEKTAVKLPIKALVKDRIRAQIDKAMTAEKKPYWLAAQFYNEYENNPAKALENIKLAVKDNPKAFYMWLYKAKLEKELGDKTAAMQSSKTSLELATAEKNDDYIKMNLDLQKKL